MEQKVLFKTLHGSNLYGLAHVESDRDYYIVVDKVKTARARYAKQRIVGDEDTMTVDFGTWVDMCISGVPQACEAMFAQAPWVRKDLIGDFRSSFRLGTTALERYLRTITSFSMTQDPKRKRHGLRLALNCYDWQRQGYFNPTLSANEAEWATAVAKKDCDVVYATAMNIALDRLPPRMLR